MHMFYLCVNIGMGLLGYLCMGCVFEGWKCVSETNIEMAIWWDVPINITFGFLFSYKWVFAYKMVCIIC